MNHYKNVKKLYFIVFFLSIFAFVVTISSVSAKKPTLLNQSFTNQIDHIGQIDESIVPSQKESLGKTSLATNIPSQKTSKGSSISGATSSVSAIVQSAAFGSPTRLEIPKIGVNTYIEHLGLTPEGAVAAPAGAVNVSWFTGGVKPGQFGSAVISGHYGIWKNKSNSVFNRLPEVRVGDAIYVKDSAGKTLTFIVKKTQIYNKDASVPELFAKSGPSILNIITCNGTYLPSLQTYSHRLVVTAELIA